MVLYTSEIYEVFYFLSFAALFTPRRTFFRPSFFVYRGNRFLPFLIIVLLQPINNLIIVLLQPINNKIIYQSMMPSSSLTDAGLVLYPLP